MIFKVSYNNQIHRISKAPASHSQLLQVVANLFKDQLPEKWTLQYVDSDGDSIMLSDEHDFQNLLEGEAAGNKAVKIFVTADEGINQSQLLRSSSVPESVTESQSQKQADDFQVIEKQEKVAASVEETKVEEVKPAEEPVTQVVESVQKDEEEVPVVENPEETQENKVEEPKKEIAEQKTKPKVFIVHNKLSLKEVMKKLAKPDLSPEKRSILETKLRAFESSLTPDDREIFVARKEKFAKHHAEKKSKADSRFSEKVTTILYQYLPTIASLTKEYVEEDNKKARPEPKVQAKVLHNVQLSRQPQPEVKSQIVHRGVRCDGCNKYPIVGIRYKCYQCPDFDFCENCEANKEHAHPFIKYKQPKGYANDRRGPQGFPAGPVHQPMNHGHVNPFIFRAGPVLINDPNVFKLQKPQNEQPVEKKENPKSAVPSEVHEAAREASNASAKFVAEELKNLRDAFLSTLQEKPIEKKVEEKEKDIDFEIPAELKEGLDGLLKALPEGLMNLFKVFVPTEEKTENKEAKVEEEPKKNEVIIAEEPVVSEVKAEVNQKENEPVIQVVEKVPEVKEEPKVEKYSQEVRDKASVLKEVFSHVSEEVVLEFVSRNPWMSVQELVENYLYH